MKKGGALLSKEIDELMKEQYLDKISTLALLTLGGLSKKELMELPDVTKEDIEAAYQQLTARAYAHRSVKVNVPTDTYIANNS